jgi:hypothetical protein
LISSSSPCNVPVRAQLTASGAHSAVRTWENHASAPDCPAAPPDPGARCWYRDLVTLDIVLGVSVQIEVCATGGRPTQYLGLTVLLSQCFCKQSGMFCRFTRLAGEDWWSCFLYEVCCVQSWTPPASKLNSLRRVCIARKLQQLTLASASWMLRTAVQLQPQLQLQLSGP